MTRIRRKLLKEMGFKNDLEMTDLTLALKDTKQKVLMLERQIEDCHKEIESKDRIIAEKNEYIRKLTEEKTISASASSAPVKTSNNSSVPPSRNPIGIKHTKSLREKSGRKTGGQKGHEGHTLKAEDLPPVSETVKWVPPSTCPKCGFPIDTEHLEDGKVRYVVDIPTSVLLNVTKHISMVGKCADGHKIEGLFPEGINAYISYGENITALVAYLNTYCNVPFKKLSSIIEMIFGIRISDGTVSNMLDKMRKLGKKPYDMIRDAVAKSEVVGADETGININGKNQWIWTFQSEVATLLVCEESRGRVVIKKYFTDAELKEMILESDRWRSYFTINIKGHQLCLAHILRNLIYCSEVYTQQKWSTDMLELLRDAIHQKNVSPGNMLSPEDCAKYRKRLDELLDTDIGIDLPKKNELTPLKESLGKYREHIFTCLSNSKVHTTNNNSEKSLRPAKTKQKVSGCFRTKKGGENYVTIASVLQTAIKNGQNPLGALKAVAHLAYE
ncbi:MAG: IS66 family transposase [Prevotellaceae bacterium]|nr:IS66 family transposase [Prevotellaceae bacterium]